MSWAEIVGEEMEAAIGRLRAAADREDARRAERAAREREFLERTRLLVEELLDDADPNTERLRREIRARFARTDEALEPAPVLPEPMLEPLRTLAVDVRLGRITGNPHDRR